MKAITTIKLVAAEKSRDFSLEEAQSIVKDELQRGSVNWKLPDNSPFKINNGIIELTSTDADRIPAKQSSTSKGSKAGK